jgi:alkylation response protein AidB-like acyl-CoA dehydrogenase
VTIDSFDLAALAASAEHRTMLHDIAEGIISRRWSTTEVRRHLDLGVEFWSAELWDDARTAGWVDLLLPEPDGGGGTMEDLCTIAEAVGETAGPLPLAGTAAAAWYLGYTPEEGITLLLDGSTHQPATLDDDGFITGTLPLVHYGITAARVVVSSTRHGMTHIVAVDLTAPGVTRTPVQVLDFSPSAAVSLDHAVVQPLAMWDTPPDNEPNRWAGAVHRLRLGLASELVGVATAANGAAVDYARTRVTFGRPIGTNQAIKHQLVDNRCDLEIAKALLTRAALDVETGALTAGASVSLAVFWAVTRLRPVTEHALHVFGGIGFTWEHAAHLHLRRAAVLATLLGPVAQHRAAIVAWLVQRSTT